MRLGAFIGIIVIVLAGAAGAQAARTWLFNDGSDIFSLVYGTPESDDVVISFTCEPADKQMRISEFVGADNLLPGRSADLKLAAGSASVTYHGLAVANEMDGTVNVDVVTHIDPKLFTVLKGGPTLTIDVAGKAQTLPLAGAAKDIAAFEKACGQR